MTKNLGMWTLGSVNGDEYYTLERTADQIAQHLVTYHLKAWLPFNDVNSVWGGY